jgi:hypothetical protein
LVGGADVLVGEGTDVFVGDGKDVLVVGGMDVFVGDGTDVPVVGGMDVFVSDGKDVFVGVRADVLVGRSAVLVDSGFGSLTLNTGLPRAWSSRMTSCSNAGSRGLRRAPYSLSAL